ncbi:MAG: HD domain-containing protein [Planctomycetes bacterium]|nr:HD domain-containing protein [Planctomycetota bacterium]
MDNPTDINAQNQSTLLAVTKLAQTCEYETTHTHQVTFLALRLFDDLQGLHNLGQQERLWLQCAGILHDIGWIEGWHGHHKTALRIILNTPLLPFKSKERLIIGSIARYHRKALPDPHQHDHFATLSHPEQNVVRKLSAFLRLADGLDRTHCSRVKDLKCSVTPRKIVVQCFVGSIPLEEAEAALAKSDLLQVVFKRKLILEWKTESW